MPTLAHRVRAMAPSGVMALLLFAALFAGGCMEPLSRPTEVAVAPGVTFRRDESHGAQVLDVDLSTADIRPVVVADSIERIRNNHVGDARTVREWAEAKGALGGLNAGFFGETYDDRGKRKQIVGLTVQEGQVVVPGGMVQSTRRPGERFLRAAIGFGESGAPDISWASGTRLGGVLRFPEPINPEGGLPWGVRSAVACGPRLFVRGEKRITDAEERLASPGRLSRAFVAYDLVDGSPRHLVLGRADAMEYDQVAAFLSAYFRERHGTQPHDALCLDGGPSAQLVYRAKGGGIEDAEPTGVTVPTAILLLPK